MSTRAPRRRWMLTFTRSRPLDRRSLETTDIHVASICQCHALGG